MERISQKQADEMIKQGREEIRLILEQGGKVTKTVIEEKGKTTTTVKIELPNGESSSSTIVQNREDITINPYISE